MTYWFVNVDGKWSKPFTYYPVAKYNSTKKDVKIYEVNLDVRLMQKLKVKLLKQKFNIREK